MKFKNLNTISACFLAGTLLFTSCKDDEGNEFQEPNGDKVSTLTTEQHKENLESEGIAFVNNMKAASNMEAYQVMDAFSDLMDDEDYYNSAHSISNRIKNIANNPQQAASLKSISYEVGAENPSDTFFEESGIYTWDASENDFVKTANSNDIISYTFPVEDQNATFVISNFASTTLVGAEGSMDIEVPTSLNAKLTLGTTVLCEFGFSAEFFDNATPKYLKETLLLEGYLFESVMDLRNQALAKSDNKFEYNGANIFACGFAIDGNIDLDQIMKDLDEEGTPSSNQEVINRANAYFQIGNIKIDGLINAKELIEAMTTDSSGEMTKEDVEVEAEKLNEAIQTYIRYANSDEIFAKGDFYVAETTNSYYDYSSQEEIYQSYYNSDMRIVYPDGSAISTDVLDSGFSDMIKEMNKLIVDMNNNYDMDLEEI